MLKNINVFKNLNAKMSDSDDFLAGVTFAVSSLQCVGAMWGMLVAVHCGRLCGRLCGRPCGCQSFDVN